MQILHRFAGQGWLADVQRRSGMNAAKRGEVWLVDLGQPKEDHEQAGRRPAVIFETDDLSVLNTVVIIPLTTQ
jgi:hypothetical protein